MGLPPGLVFRTKGQLAIDIAAEALADGIAFDFFCGDEVYGSCTELREFFEARGQAYVLRVPKNFRLTLASGQEVNLRGRRQPAGAPAGSVRSAPPGRVPRASAGMPGRGWPPPPREHCLLIRRHLRTGELAFHYCFVPGGQPLTLTRLIRAAGLRWPVEEQFRAGQGLLRPR